ncbi:RNA-binding domain-containing protein [Blastococcus saxobsidens]|uniref:Putative transcriptional regulator n=1 Tax=Blastococcus saxobsidens (strain DD2) TaxID=1146883 RepID=H6RNY9_BLASD|nr:RNA-binding domain-containing protein [Blastococcus saxobsidens]CCG01451.1 putative transcriptional regulator [Blastococcus saxobsidens DD2]
MTATTDLPRLLQLIWKGTRSASSLEGQMLDFKTEKGSTKETAQDLAEAAVCFANANGGLLVVGVTDNGTGPGSFVGTTSNADDIRTRIHALTEPPLVTDVAEHRHEGQRLLTIRVPQGLDVYATKKGLVTRRWNDQCLPMRPADVSRLDDERRGNDWTAQPTDRTPSDVDSDAMLRVRNLLRGTPDATRRRLAEATDVDILHALRVVTETGHLTRAGETLLCQNAKSANDEILVYQYRPTPGGEATAVRRWGTPLVLAFAEAIETISARNGITPVNTAGGQQLQVEDYPSVAVREALANALIHGDYREKRPVQVEHSPEVLTVASPGPLVSGITPRNILTSGSRARFPSLATALRTLGLAEGLGQGVDRMFREMVRSGRSVPEVKEEETQGLGTRVTFRGGPPNARITRFIADLPDTERDDTDTLLIVRMLCEQRTVTASQAADVIQRDIEATEAVLRRLSSGEAELLEPTAGTALRKKPTYRLRGGALASLGPAVKYHRRATTDVNKKVVDHVREYGTINNATVQRVFDVDVYQARDILRDFVGREILVRVSEQQRGVAVKYGPGPSFPEKRTRRRVRD